MSFIHIHKKGIIYNGDHRSFGYTKYDGNWKNGTAQESRLPAFLLEGIVEGLLADIRARKNAELAAAMNTTEEDKEDG